MIRRFEIHDDQGETIAEGVEFTDGTVAIRAPHGTAAVIDMAHVDQPGNCPIVWIDNIMPTPAEPAVKGDTHV